MNEYIFQLESENKNKQTKVIFIYYYYQSNSSEETVEDIDILNTKIAELIKQLEDKDQKYITLLERLRQTQDKFQHCEADQDEKMKQYISKDQHKSVLSK